MLKFLSQRRRLLPGPAAAAIIGACIAVTALLSHQVLSSDTGGCVRLGDFSAIELDVRSAAQGQQLLGPYSRFRFHHPGPLSAYLYAVPAVLFGSEWLGIRVFEAVQIWISLLLLLGTALICTHLQDGWRRGSVILLIMLAVAPALHPYIFSDIWGPSRVVIPLALLLPILSLVRAGMWWAMPLAVLTASLVAANHITAAPAILLVVVTTLFALLFSRHGIDWSGVRRPFVWALLLGALSWLPPLVEALSNQGGNLARILKQAGEAPISSSPLEALQMMATWATGVEKKTTALCVMLIVLLFPVARWRSLDQVLRHWFLLNVAATLGFLWSTMHLRGRAFDYLFWPQWGIAISVISLTLCVLWEWARRVRGMRSRLTVDAVVVTILSIGAIVSLSRTDARSCEAIPWLVNAQQVLEKLSTQGHIVVASQWFRDWDKLGVLAVRVEQGGRSVCIEPRFRFIYGNYSCSLRAAEQRPERLVVFVRSPSAQCGGEMHRITNGRYLLVQDVERLNEQLHCVRAGVQRRRKRRPHSESLRTRDTM